MKLELLEDGGGERGFLVGFVVEVGEGLELRRRFK